MRREKIGREGFGGGVWRKKEKRDKWGMCG